MLVSRESIQRIYDFQKDKSKELKRPVTYSEALALWFSQSQIVKKVKNRKQKAAIQDINFY